MIYKQALLRLLVLICPLTIDAQKYPKDYFRNPLDIPMELVANFGELRPNHWHMGLDVRTNQKVNLPVYAAADGYVSKVKIEPEGFGQSIFINHPNGFTTVYAHLNAFFPALTGYVKEQQYKLQSWQVEIKIPEELFPVKKGDFIAYSGNTGASQGPHLHFEIRNTETEKCLNPLLFGFPVADYVPPTLIRLALYDRNKSTYHQQPRLISL
ncbi:MAG: M23 family metallopeptidase, partial [Chitinophagaceae bacterium]|nr:M23 family metallopeptidase [Chitinophagaceae bacterium]